MKTATIDDLRHRLTTVFSWLEAGEDVVVKSGAGQAPRTAAPPPPVDWTHSAAFRRDRTGEPVLSRQDLDALFEDLRGSY